MCIEALAAGKHVICEKPVTMSSAELEEVIAAAKKYGKVFTIDQNRRVNKDFVRMKRSVEEGLLGDVYVIESRVGGLAGHAERLAHNKKPGRRDDAGLGRAPH